MDTICRFILPNSFKIGIVQNWNIGRGKFYVVSLAMRIKGCRLTSGQSKNLLEFFVAGMTARTATELTGKGIANSKTFCYNDINVFGFTVDEYNTNTMNTRQHVFLFIVSFFVLFVPHAFTAEPDFLWNADNLTLVFSTPSEDSSGSVPLGNGENATNIWVEKKTGDLLLLLARTDSFDGFGRLLKPPPFSFRIKNGGMTFGIEVIFAFFQVQRYFRNSPCHPVMFH